MKFDAEFSITARDRRNGPRPSNRLPRQNRSRKARTRVEVKELLAPIFRDTIADDRMRGRGFPPPIDVVQRATPKPKQ